MKAKKLVKSLGMAAVALTLVSACMVGSTLAKYTTEITGSGTAVVAKWAFTANVNGQTPADKTALGSFTLADTVNTVGIKNDRIAPGTSGTVKVDYDLSDSEVAANVKVFIKLSDASATLPTGLTFTKSDDTAVTITGAEYTEVFSTDVKDFANAKKETCEVKWAWAAEGNDAADTALGETASTLKFDIKVVGTQLAPEAPAA